MALDGVVISGIISELKHKLVGGRIYKIYQPEVDEINLVVKNKVDDENITSRLVLSADATLPLMYLNDRNKENPAVAPNFCMLLRKHIGNGRIIDIKQPEFERIAEFTIEHLDEMGDLCTKKLVIEIMGKHSNIIFVDSDNVIIDSIKHISHQISSVREVLPGRCYEYPPAKDKKNPMTISEEEFVTEVLAKPIELSKAIYTSLTGISPVIANEICYRAGLDGNVSTDALTASDKGHLLDSFKELVDTIQGEKYISCIAYNGYEPKEFSCIKLTSYGEFVDNDNIPAADVKGLKAYDSISMLIAEYYSGKSVITRIKQKSTDLRKIVANAIERTSKKYDLQIKQLKDTEKRDKYKVYGELINTYGYNLSDGASVLKCINYYDGNEIEIPLDKDFSPIENSKRYFAKYNKLKRTYEALSVLSVESKEELDYLLSVQNSLEYANSENDLAQIKSELIESGYIKGRIQNKKGSKNVKSKPLHYISSDGYHMYVGKNNFQNEELTFDFANGSDLWFHAKQMPGSHVIVKTNGEDLLPDRTYEEAARLAAYYSTGRTGSKVDVDYTAKKNLKKPPKAKPGYVIYHTNYSMTIEPDIHGIKEEK